MNLSRYTLFVENYPEADVHVAYNTRTKAIVSIDSGLKDTLTALPSRNGGRGEKTLEALQQLMKLGIVVDDAVDEKQLVADGFGRIQADTSRLKATILTTYACNFACTYCLENGVKASRYMNRETAARCVAFITRKAEEISPKRLVVTFYGGEPLLNLPAIKDVARGLQQLGKSRGIPFDFGITTNGALLTPEVVTELKAYGLKGVKITLDGTKEFHDQKRPFKNGKRSFDVIMRNLVHAVDEIDVKIGGNFDDENAESIPALLDHLAELGLTRKIRIIVFKPITRTFSDRKLISPGTDIGCVYTEADTKYKMVQYQRMLLERGFRTNVGMGANLCAMILNRSNFTIDPNGKLFLCSGFVGLEEFECGSVNRGESGKSSLSEVWRQCLDCPYLPLCGNGCPSGAHVRFGDASRLNCMKEYMDYVAPESVKMSYDVACCRKHGSNTVL